MHLTQQHADLGPQSHWHILSADVQMMFNPSESSDAGEQVHCAQSQPKLSLK